mmetsp:Transcript_44186/g.32160  ORF Transcript_44186/g.32160 Transcript_44186/m.32160 type:complete len:82 (-) Transcript_44186:1151-1396(-)
MIWDVSARTALIAIQAIASRICVCQVVELLQDSIWNVLAHRTSSAILDTAVQRILVLSLVLTVKEQALTRQAALAQLEQIA